MTEKNADPFVGQPRRGIERLFDEIKHLEEQLSLASVEIRSYIEAAVTLQEENEQLKQRIKALEALHSPDRG